MLCDQGSGKGVKNDDDVCKEGEGILAHLEKVKWVKGGGGYNTMKEQAFQETIKSTFALENGGKIIK